MVSALGVAHSNRQKTLNSKAGLGLGGALGDIDPLNKVPFKRATSRVQKGPL